MSSSPKSRSRSSAEAAIPRAATFTIVPVFVDTNVLVYSRDATERTKQPRAAAWLGHLWSTRQGRISVQVLQEFYVTVTRKLNPGMGADAARRDVMRLATWRPVSIDETMLEDAWVNEDRFNLAFWDALIVSAARASGCRHLLTDDLQAGQEFNGVLVVDPFAVEPGELA